MRARILAGCQPHSLNYRLEQHPTPNTSTPKTSSTMAKPEKNLTKLREEQAEDDADLLADLDKESKEFDKVSQPLFPLFHSHPNNNSQDSEIDRITKAFRANAYDVLDLQPGVPDDDIKKTYRKKSLLIHPDKSTNPRAPDAFDRLAAAYQTLLDEKKRATLDEAIADARMLLIRERKLTVDSEEVKDPDTDFVKAWKEKVKFVLADMEDRRKRQMKAQMQEEGREQRRADEELAERKRKREHEVDWEKTREQRIGSWRAFQEKGEAGKKKVKKMKTLG